MLSPGAQPGAQGRSRGLLDARRLGTVCVSPIGGSMRRLMTVIPLALRQRRPVLLPVAFLCLLVLGLAPQASAAGSGFFSPTGSMSVPRFAAAAAPLPDGRVLVAGGATGPTNIERRDLRPRHRLLLADRLDVRRARRRRRGPAPRRPGAGRWRARAQQLSRAPRSSTRPPTPSARRGSARCPSRATEPSRRRSPTAGYWSRGGLHHCDGAAA